MSVSLSVSDKLRLHTRGRFLHDTRGILECAKNASSSNIVDSVHTLLYATPSIFWLELINYRKKKLRAFIRAPKIFLLPYLLCEHKISHLFHFQPHCKSINLETKLITSLFLFFIIGKALTEIVLQLLFPMKPTSGKNRVQRVLMHRIHIHMQSHKKEQNSDNK